ncbi:hypothetical protein Ancab_025981 [Ancistrocladus abbreviatus]
MECWIRGDLVGRGSFATVNLAIPATDNPLQISPSVVMKSSEFSNSDSLRNEKEVLSKLQDCPQIVRLIGDNVTVENGKRMYNLFLEYASRGSLAEQLKSVNCFKESDVRRYTKSILRGLSFIHEKGFVHRDIKLQNILLFDDGSAKIADFGLARMAEGEKKRGEKDGGFVLRGTPLYMSPELLKGTGEGESPADIWALGCVVLEMITSMPAWKTSRGCDVSALLYRIGVGAEIPEIPANLCAEGRDFLGKCFERDPNKRWTARMLLDHPFVYGLDVSCDSELREPCSIDTDDDDRTPSMSPRGPFDFPDLVSMDSSNLEGAVRFGSPEYSDGSGFWAESVEAREFYSWSEISDRIQQLSSDRVPDWSESDGWVTVR